MTQEIDSTGGIQSEAAIPQKYQAKKFDWRIFFILLGAATFGVIAVIPYSLAVQQMSLARLQALTPMPVWMLLTLQILQNVVLFAVAIGLGLLAANRIGLGLPILEARLAGEKVGGRVRAILPISIIVGVVGSLVIIGIDAWGFGPAMKTQLGALMADLSPQTLQPAAWKGLLASFYGGIDEEILLRLFLMSVLAWPGRTAYHRRPVGRECPGCHPVRAGASTRHGRHPAHHAAGDSPRHRAERAAGHRLRLSLHDPRPGLGHGVSFLGGHRAARGPGAVAIHYPRRPMNIV
jgi:hypothetical protein